MKAISVEVVTPEKIIFKGTALSIVLPAVSGEMGVLPGHAPLITILKQGDIRLEKEEGKETFAVKGGFAEVGPEMVKVFIEGLARAGQKT